MDVYNLYKNEKFKDNNKATLKLNTLYYHCIICTLNFKFF